MEPKFTPVNTILIIINTAIFAFQALAGEVLSDVIYMFGVMEWNWILTKGEYYRFFTSMFLHFGVDHLFQNMIFLFFVGCYLEKALGSVKYLFFYLLSGIGAGLASFLFDTCFQVYGISAGASGAIFGVVGGLLYIVICNKGRYEGIGLPGMAVMIMGSLYYGFTADGVDNMAHLGGLLAGFLLGFIFYKEKKEEK